VKAILSSDATKSVTATVTLLATAPPPPASPLAAVMVGTTQMKVTWTAPSGSSSSDTITLTSPGAPNWWTLWSGSTKGAATGSFTVSVPSSPGLFEFRYFKGGTSTPALISNALGVNTSAFTIVPTPATVAKSGKITVAWTAPSGRPTGWDDTIGLYKVGTASDSPISYIYTRGGTSGSYTVTAPSSAGTYEFRYMLAGDTYVCAALSAKVTVQ